MIEITLKLDTDKIEEAMRSAWQLEFACPDRYNSRTQGGAGWVEVMRQVRAYIQEMDLSGAIAAAAKANLARVVDEAITMVLREEVKKRAKEMKKEGTLLS